MKILHLLVIINSMILTPEHTLERYTDIDERQALGRQHPMIDEYRD